ncbi:LexA family protein [Aquirhabdus sp.]|uniref:LexA family protein n=1 Tax=Aquirhabdus sp. TaxID=2824160 RepID=UPI00396CFD3A
MTSTYPLTAFEIKPVEITTETYHIPIALERVSAGFPSPATEYMDGSIDLNKHLIKNKKSTFIVRVNSMSMRDAGISIDDELVVDRSITAECGDVVIALINNEFTVKTLMIEALESDQQKVWLRAENPEFKSIYPRENEDIEVWGVVTSVIKNVYKRKRKRS